MITGINICKIVKHNLKGKYTVLDHTKVPNITVLVTVQFIKGHSVLKYYFLTH